MLQKYEAGRKKTSSSQYHSTSPSHKRYSSRSPTRRRSTSRSSRNPLKRKVRGRDVKDRELKVSPRRKSANYGNDLYKEFEAAREKLCFKLEEEFHVYKTMPNLYDKYEECYEGFMQMYKIQYPNHSEEHKEKLWKEFWKSKFDFVEKTELRNRMVNLIGRFKQKVQSVPPAPSRPIKFVIHPPF
ncbi:hypothetical protein Avbf_16871 [Armadillidium vulgare]|nr:hypothetical protein Avbf_16871 [Armadillidium vulgare]